MKKGLHDWFQDLQDVAEPRRAPVAANLPTLVTVKPMPVPGAGGLITIVDMTHTSTS